MWLLALPLAFLLLGPVGNVRALTLVIWVVFAVTVCAASRVDLRERGAPAWSWLVVWVVALPLSALGGFVLWMILRQRWPLPSVPLPHIDAASDATGEPLL
jgi:hypothetical protein